MRRHILLAAAIALITALTIRSVTSYGQTGKMRGTRKRPTLAGPRQQTADSVSTLPAPDMQAPVDLKARPRTELFSPAAFEDPLATDQVVTPQTTAAAINCDWVSINHGGATEVASGDLRLGVSVGQNVAGFVAGGPYQMGLGFWYGTAAAGGGCACDCFGDPMCDGVASILDVVRAVDVAFRGGAPYFDPDPACPLETTDVTCDGVTTILDVVRMVDVAFRGGDAEVLYCDPCAP